MYHTVNKLLFLFLLSISSPLFSAVLQTLELTLQPKTPVVVTNTNALTINALCEIHTAPYTQNSISIRIISGKGVFNGTTFKQGDYMVWALYNLQQMPLIASPGAQALVTNLGTYPVNITLYYA